MLRFALLLGLASMAAACSSDSDCPFDQACSTSYPGFCYQNPHRLHQYCTKDTDCTTNVDIWSECFLNECRCWSWKYERSGGCWSSANTSIVMIILVYTLIPVAVFLTIVFFVVRMMRRRQVVTTVVTRTAQPQYQTLNVPPPVHTGFAPPPPPASYPTGFAPPPPGPPPPPTYSQSQGVPKY